MNIKSAIKLVTRKFNRNDDEPKTIRDVAVEALAPIIEDYSHWYDEHGLYLPPDFATRPTDWCEELHAIKRALNLLKDEKNGEGELWEAKNAWKEYGEHDAEKVEELNKFIDAAFTSIGKQLLYLTDPKNGVSGH
jgi:hypothetical protein